MCAHFESVSKPERLKVSFNVDMPEGAKADVWPGYMGLFIRRPKQEPENESQALSREAMVGTFGLIPHWANETLLAKRTYNARSETVGVCRETSWTAGTRG